MISAGNSSNEEDNQDPKGVKRSESGKRIPEESRRFDIVRNFMRQKVPNKGQVVAEKENWRT